MCVDLYESIERLTTLEEWVLMCRILSRLQKVPQAEENGIETCLLRKGNELLQAHVALFRASLSE